MNWIINGDGSVRSATVAETQMRSDAVEQCLASRIKGTYPFVFKQP